MTPWEWFAVAAGSVVLACAAVVAVAVTVAVRGGQLIEEAQAEWDD